MTQHAVGATPKIQQDGLTPDYGPNPELLGIANDNAPHTVGTVACTLAKTYVIEITFLIRDTVTGKGFAAKHRAVIQGDPAAPTQISITSEYQVNNIGVNAPTVNTTFAGTLVSSTVQNPAAGNLLNAEIRFEVLAGPT